jgi:antitoxin ParD1/3/4
MTTMNVSLPDSLKRFVDQCVESGGYGSSSEYVRELIRQDQMRRAEQRLAELLREGLESGPPVEVNSGYWAERRAKLGKPLDK